MNQQKSDYNQTATKDLAMSKPATAQTLNIRITTVERKLIERAAEIAGKNVDNFIQDSLACAAADVLLDQNLIITTSAKYTEFLLRLDRPPASNERLQKTMQMPTPWTKQ
ncbi:type II toxin-antitoxin system TacA family antitoxin [Duganella sp. PWIR1]